jgi:type VI protein secretion system component Hcp
MRAPLKVVVPTAAAIGAGAAIGAVALGAIPGPDGVIHACYNIGNAKFAYGQLRVIDPSKQGQDVSPAEYQCTSGEETPISWNQRGPQGPQGPAGATGAQGVAGPGGASGAAGSDGSVTIVGNTNFSIAASAHVALFLKLDDIKGESTQKDHKGELVLDTFAFGSEAPVVGSQSSGAGAGKVTISTFEIVKRLDSADPDLQRDLATGKVIAGGEVEVVHRSSTGGRQVASYKLTDLALKSISIKGEDETVLGSFRGLRETLGTGPNSVTAKWNKIANSGSWNLVAHR